MGPPVNPVRFNFGGGTASSSDSQHFPLAWRGKMAGAVNPHRGSGPAASFYTHVSDRYPTRRRKPSGTAPAASAWSCVATSILWNTVYRERAIGTLCARGEHIPGGLPGHLAPP